MKVRHTSLFRRVGVCFVLLFLGCSDKQGGGTVDPKMSVTVTAPSTVAYGNDIVAQFGVKNSDSQGDTDYTLSREGMPDSTVTRTFSAGNSTDSFEVENATVDGTLVARFQDSDDIVTKVVEYEVGDQQNSPSEIDMVSLQENLYTGTDISFEIDVTDSDGISRVVLYDSQTDSTVFDNIASPSFTEVVTRNFSSPQEFTPRVRVVDEKNEPASESYSFSIVDEDSNSPAELSITLPENLYTNEDLVAQINAKDQDTLEQVVFKTSPTDSTVYDDVNSDQFTETQTLRYSQPQTISLTLRSVDVEGVPNSITREFNIVNREDNQPTYDLNFAQGRGPQTWSAEVIDVDGLANANIEYSRVGSGESTSVPMNITGNTADVSFTSPTEPGTYDIFIRSTDDLGNPNVREECAQILSPLQDRNITVNTPYAGIDVRIDLNFLGQTQNGVTDEQGNFSSNFTGVQDSTIAYTLLADALGLQERVVNGESSGDVNREVNPNPVSATISSTLSGQYPRTSDEVNLANEIQIVDTEGNVPYTLQVESLDNVFDVENVSAQLYRFTTSDTDPANTQGTVDVIVETAYNQQTQEVSKEVFARRQSSVVNSFPSGKENTDLVLEDFVQNYIQSPIAIDTFTVESVNGNLSVLREGDDIVLSPENGFTGFADISVYLQNRDGFEVNETRMLNFEELPKARVNVVNSVTNQPVESYMLFLDSNEAVLDSLNSMNGEFVASIPEDAASISVAEKEGATVKGFEHLFYINSGQSLERDVAVEDFREYDINRHHTGDLTLLEAKKFKYLMEYVHGRAPVINLDGGSQGNFPGVLHRATESLNGIGYDLFVIADTTDWVLFNETGIMEPGTSELVKHVYETEIAPIMGDFAAPVEVRDRIVYDHASPTPNTAYFNPRQLRDSFGSNNVLGKLPFTNQHSLAQLLSDGTRKVLTDEAKTYTAIQEIVSGNIYFTILPADFGGSNGIPTEYQFSKDKIAIHDDATPLKLYEIDMRAGWMIYEPLHTSGEKIDDLLRIPNQLKSQYDSL